MGRRKTCTRYYTHVSLEGNRDSGKGTEVSCLSDNAGPCRRWRRMRINVRSAKRLHETWMETLQKHMEGSKVPKFLHLFFFSCNPGFFFFISRIVQKLMHGLVF